jgi:putative transposase
VVAVTDDWWLEDWEKKAILDFHAEHLLEGYQRRAYTMLDADTVAVSPASVDRVPRAAGLRERHHATLRSRARASSNRTARMSTGT